MRTFQNRLAGSAFDFRDSFVGTLEDMIAVYTCGALFQIDLVQFSSHASRLRYLHFHFSHFLKAVRLQGKKTHLRQPV